MIKDICLEASDEEKQLFIEKIKEKKGMIQC